MSVRTRALAGLIALTVGGCGGCGERWDRNFSPDDEGPHGMSMIEALLRTRFPEADYGVIEGRFGESLPETSGPGELYVAVGPALAYDSAEVAALAGFVSRGGRALLASHELSIGLSRAMSPDDCLDDVHDVYAPREVSTGDTLLTNRGEAYVLTPVTRRRGSPDVMAALYAAVACDERLNVLLEVGHRPFNHPHIGLGSGGPELEGSTGERAQEDSEEEGHASDGGDGGRDAEDQFSGGDDLADADDFYDDPAYDDGPAYDDDPGYDDDAAYGAGADSSGGGGATRSVLMTRPRTAVMTEVPLGDGHFLVLGAPVLLANAYVADTANRAAIEAVLSYVGPDLRRIRFDAERRSSVWEVEMANRPLSDYRPPPPERESLLREVFKRPALAAAWYLLLGGVLTFVLFGAKRVQRIVPVRQPRLNTTLAYLGNVSRLYLARPNNVLMARKQLGLFEAFCQRKFGLRPVHEPADRPRLAELRGVDPRLVESLARYQNTISGNQGLSNDAFLRLMHILRALYGQLGRRAVVS